MRGFPCVNNGSRALWAVVQNLFIDCIDALPFRVSVECALYHLRDGCVKERTRIVRVAFIREALSE